MNVYLRGDNTASTDPVRLGPGTSYIMVDVVSIPIFNKRSRILLPLPQIKPNLFTELEDHSFTCDGG